MVGKSTIPKNRELPPKESALFKAVVQFYEHKQYKKGLKSAEQILKKFPDHGETLSLKGLFMSHLSKKEEALPLIKLGIKHDITSHVCWHVMGLYHRAEHNYVEAMRCYKTALKFDSENLQVIRDLSVLQIQTRHYEGFLETKNLMLQLRPSMKVNWIGLSIAYFLLKRYDAAIGVITAYLEAWQQNEGCAVENLCGYEISEILLFRAIIYEEAGQFDKLYSSLTDKLSSKIMDNPARRELIATALLKLNRNLEAKIEYTELLKWNPDHLDYIMALENIADIRSKNSHEIVDFYDKMKSELPDSSFFLLRPLYFLNNTELFTEALRQYVLPRLRKGVPSLFSSIRSCYANNPIVKDCVKSFFDNLLPTVSVESDEYIWSLYYLSQHHLYFSNFDLAISLAKRAIGICPRNVDFMMHLAKCLKKQGHLAEAITLINDARLVEPSDRYVNSKCVKYLFKNGEIEQARQIASLFLKGEYPAKLEDLFEMQTLWYEIELAEAYKRNRQLSLALDVYHRIIQQFEDFIEDQFDFHTYAVRKMTIRHYIGLLRFEDSLLNESSIYAKSMEGAILCYLDLDKDSDLLITCQMEAMNVKPTTIHGETEKLPAKACDQTMRLDDATSDIDEEDESSTASNISSQPASINRLSGNLKDKAKALFDRLVMLQPNNLDRFAHISSHFHS